MTANDASGTRWRARVNGSITTPHLKANGLKHAGTTNAIRDYRAFNALGSSEPPCLQLSQSALTSLQFRILSSSMDRSSEVDSSVHPDTLIVTRDNAIGGILQHPGGNKRLEVRQRGLGETVAIARSSTNATRETVASAA